MIGAALLAKKAVEKGLSSKPWVKTTLAPGSKVVTDYYDRAGLTPYMEKLGFNLVGYGCVTCIGNSGPLPVEISKAINENDLAVTAVLSGNRNFEGRISPDIKMNYLASPPLVVAYALAGTMDHDFENDSIGNDKDGKAVYLKDIWPTTEEIQSVINSSISSEMFTKDYATVFEGDHRWKSLATPTGKVFEWDLKSTYVRKPPYFEGMPRNPEPVKDISKARVLAVLGDSVTTDHISPAGNIKADSPAGKYLAEHGVKVVIAESFERIHRSNLIGMGVLPLQFPAGANAASLGLTGSEEFSVVGIEALNTGGVPKTRKVIAGDKSFDAVVRIDTPGEADYFRHGGIMQYVLRSLL